MRSPSQARAVRLSLLAVCVAGLLALAACGGGEEPDANGSVIDSAGVEFNADDDRALAEAIVLRLSDFPSGWRTAEDEDEDEDDRTFRDCFERVEFSDVTVTGRAGGDGFEMGVPAAGSVAAVFADEQQASMAHTRMSEALNECFVESLEDASDSDFTVGEVEIGELSFPGFGDDSSAFQIQISIEDEESDLSVNAFADLVYVRAGRANVYDVVIAKSSLTRIAPPIPSSSSRRSSSVMTSVVSTGSPSACMSHMTAYNRALLFR